MVIINKEEVLAFISAVNSEVADPKQMSFSSHTYWDMPDLMNDSMKQVFPDFDNFWDLVEREKEYHGIPMEYFAPYSLNLRGGEYNNDIVAVCVLDSKELPLYHYYYSFRIDNCYRQNAYNDFDDLTSFVNWLSWLHSEIIKEGKNTEDLDSARTIIDKLSDYLACACGTSREYAIGQQARSYITTCFEDISRKFRKKFSLVTFSSDSDRLFVSILVRKDFIIDSANYLRKKLLSYSKRGDIFSCIDNY